MAEVLLGSSKALCKSAEKHAPVKREQRVWGNSLNQGLWTAWTGRGQHGIEIAQSIHPEGRPLKRCVFMHLSLSIYISLYISLSPYIYVYIYIYIYIHTYMHTHTNTHATTISHEFNAVMMPRSSPSWPPTRSASSRPASSRSEAV